MAASLISAAPGARAKSEPLGFGSPGGGQATASDHLRRRLIGGVRYRNQTFAAIMLSIQVKGFARRSVLCWLATVDESGQPNVSPKEIFAVFDSDHPVIAYIPSAGTARNT